MKRRRVLIHADSAVKITSSPLSVNQTGTTCGLPSSQMVASFAQRAGALRNAIYSALLIFSMRSPIQARKLSQNIRYVIHLRDFLFLPVCH